MVSIAWILSKLRFPLAVALGGSGHDGTPVALASNTNWDSIVTPGEYFVPTASGASTPFAGGNLLVKVINTASGLKQIATPYGASGTYSRAVVSGSWSQWYKSYDNTTVVGTVSQSAGLPTGAIIQYGSGSNSRWVRYADGTQIIWGSIAIGVVSYNIGVGPLWGANSPTINYPVAFVGDGPVFNLQVIAASADVWATGGQAGQPLTNIPSVLLLTPVTGNRNTIITYTAHGRWF